jgi:hypothetical protein
MTRKILLFTAMLLGVVSVASAKDPYIDTSDASRQTADGLYPVENSKLEVAFAKPGLDLGGYDALLLDTVTIAYKTDRKFERRPGSAQRMRAQLNEEETATMQEIFNEIFAEELGDGLEIVEEPGAGVLRVTPYILDLVINVPLDPTPGRSRTYVDSVAEMTLLLQVRDSASGELLAEVADRREARTLSNTMQLSTPVRDRREVERLLHSWAKLLAKRVEAVTAMTMETR